MAKKKAILNTLAAGVVGAVAAATTAVALDSKKRKALVRKGEKVIESGKELGAELVDDAKTLGNEALTAGKGLASTGLGHLQTGIGALKDKLDGKPAQAKKPAKKAPKPAAQTKKK